MMSVLIQPDQLWWFVTSLLVLLVSFLYARHYKKRITTALQRVEEAQIQATKEVADIIKETLSPRVYSRSGTRNVTREAAELVRKASGEEERADRYLIIIGAPSMTTASQDESPSTKEEPPTPNYYEQALKECPELNITRYINLPKLPEVKTRREDFQKEYLAWLKKQLTAISLNDKYRLVDVVRAPQYGTNLAKFITKRSIMEITGQGAGAITITETTIASNIRQYAVEAIEGRGYSVRNPPVVFTHDADLAGLTNLIADLEGLCAKP